jgi:hypothetical protein
MKNTSQQYDRAVQSCKDIFIKKATDYGTSWRILRTISIVDQIYIKAKRIRTIQEKRLQLVEDGIRSEFTGILNYAVMGLIQLQNPGMVTETMPMAGLENLYEEKIAAARSLMEKKNHDYDEAWRDMCQESFTDLILSKLLRMRQIIANDGKTIISEGLDANYYDIINYAVFALIQLEEAL